MNREEDMRDQETREVEARTTPGTDPRVDQLAREQEMRDGGETAGPTRMGEPDSVADRGEYEGGGMEGYRSRFADAQSRFIDDPKGAVEEAHSVLQEAVDRLMQSVRADFGGADDTEHMRMAMQRYRELFDRLVATAR